MSRRLEIEYLGPGLLAVRGQGSKGICEAVPYAIGPSWSGSRHCWLMHAAHAEAIEVLATAAGFSVAIIGARMSGDTPEASASGADQVRTSTETQVRTSTETQAALW